MREEKKWLVELGIEPAPSRPLPPQLLLPNAALGHAGHVMFCDKLWTENKWAWKLTHELPVDGSLYLCSVRLYLRSVHDILWHNYTKCLSALYMTFFGITTLSV